MEQGKSILERAAAAERAQPFVVPPAPAGPASAASMLERAAARSAGQVSRPVSFAEAQASAPADPATDPVARAMPAPQHGPRRGQIDLARLADRGYVTPGGSNTLIAEEFRLVKRQLLANVAARGPGAMKDANLILVGSAMPAEGKTFCAINLALSIAAERDLTVLLVDADVSKPEIVTRLGLEGGPGLTDVVADRALDVGDCLIRTNVPNLTVLPAGRPHGLTTELFASERMEDIMEEIARRYTDRVVIFDSPPALVNSAASVLATRVGQVVFVVAAEMTKESELKEGLALMSGCPNVQLLLNRSRFFPAGRRFAATDYYPA
jgi:protein-tyrosine kinase